MKNTPTIMVQGTTSDAGKSTLVAGLCRVYQRMGLKVAPFKPQNMALNSAVTPSGGEIGRAQAVQARAACVELDTDFNPILLKPNSDTGAQVIVHGKALSAGMEAAQYHDYKKIALNAVLESHQRLSHQYEYVVVEGAGSPAEINLRQGDIANMGFAESVDCPVIIIADIDKGGVFAHLVGTLDLLSESEQKRVVGFVINRFRGDINLLTSGLEWLEARTGKPVLGVIPYLHGLSIAAEDAVVSEQHITNAKLKVIVPVYPRMSNHNDFDPLRLHPEIDLQFVYATEDTKTPLPCADLIILPGSKNVQADLAFLKAQGWDACINKHLRYGGKLIGICGGYQMLGDAINDPLGIESSTPLSKGLGYIPMQTTLAEHKTLLNVEAHLTLNNKTANAIGYEIHAGQSVINDVNYQTLLNANLAERAGFVSQDNQIAGCYLHGLFDQTAVLQIVMSWAGADIVAQINLAEQENKAIDKLADACEQHLDIKKLMHLTEQWYQNKL